MVAVPTATYVKVRAIAERDGLLIFRLVDRLLKMGLETLDSQRIGPAAESRHREKRS